MERGRVVDAVGTEGADRLQYGQSAVWRPGTGQPPSLSQLYTTQILTGHAGS